MTRRWFTLTFMPGISICFLLNCGGNSPSSASDQIPPDFQIDSYDGVARDSSRQQDHRGSNKQKSQTHYSNALKLKRELNWDGALEEVNRAVRLYPEYANAHFTRGSILRRKKEYEKAFESFKRARELKPKYANAYAMEGAMLLRLGRDTEALGPLKMAKKMIPDDENSYMNLGLALKRLGRLEEAEAVYNEGIERLNSPPSLQNNLAVLYTTMGRNIESIVMLEDVARAKPEDFYANFNLAVAFRTSLQFEAAIPHYEKAVQIDSSHTGALYDLGHCYLEVENYPKAVEILDRYIDLIEATDPEMAAKVKSEIDILRN